MAYVIKIVATKPANVAWFKDSSPTAPQTIANMVEWDLAAPGRLSSMLVPIDADNYEATIIFDNAIHGDEWLSAKNTQPDWVLHDTYFTAHNIVTTVTIFP